MVRILRPFQGLFKVLRHPFRVQVLAALAFILLGLARLAVLVFPFRWIVPALGPKTELAAPVPAATDRQTAMAADVGRAVRSAARFTPWESVCLPQAMAAVTLLRTTGVPYLMCLGLRRSTSGQPDKQLDAHAWVLSGDVFVTGGDSDPDYVRVGCFLGQGRG